MRILHADDRGNIAVFVAIGVVAVLVVVLLLIVFVFSVPAPPSRPPTCVLTVAVTWKNSTAVQGATVLVGNETNLTNAGGFAKFTGLACGSAIVTVYPSPQLVGPTFARVQANVTLEPQTQNYRSVVVGA